MTKDGSNSLWWPRYVGDYQRKTSHLTLTEHGAYTLLLDHYYSTGKPLSANASVLQRVCRAFADEEKAAVQSVIDQFFVLEADGYHNKKADEQILRRCDISEKRKKAADERYKKLAANAHAIAPANADTTTATTKVRVNPPLIPPTPTGAKTHDQRLSPARAAARRGLEAVNRKFGFDAGE